MRQLRSYILGAGTALVLAPLGACVYAALGLVDVGADRAPPAWEATIMRAAIHASVRRRAREIPEPPPPSDSLVIAGGRRFLGDCVGCHGEPGKPPSKFGATFYPPAPQFPRIGTEYTQAQLLWVATHGIRLTGMAPQSEWYTEPKLRSLSAFIGAVKTLPPGAAGQHPRKAEAMTKFALGFVTMLAGLIAGTLAYLLLGQAEVRADVIAPAPVRMWMALTVRASVRRRAPAANPIAPTDANLITGGHLYLNGCAGCHGTPGQPPMHSIRFLPPPQFPTVGSRYTEPEMYWIIKHGIRRTGMSAYGPFYTEKEIWLLAAFVKRMPELPTAVTDSLLTGKHQ